MNIVSNTYKTNHIITVDDKDPPWMNESITKKNNDQKVCMQIF